MRQAYLSGIKIEDSSYYNGLKCIGTDAHIWYAACYDLVKEYKFIPIKKELVELTNKLKKRNTEPKNWDWHHVVETQHLATFLHETEKEKYNYMPTILIHKPEHRFFSRNFNNNAFRELATIPKPKRKKSLDVFNSGLATTENRHQRKHTINNLRMMYNNMYIKYPTLKKIANNVFDYHLFCLGV